MNNNQRGMVAGLAVLGLAALSAPMHAQTFISANTSITTAVTGNVAVGYTGKDASGNFIGPTSPTVNINTGGSVDYFLNVFNSSTFNMTAGTVFGDFYAFDNSNIFLSGGTIGGSLFAYTNSTVTLTGTFSTPQRVTSTIAGFDDFLVNGTLLDNTVLTNKNFYIHVNSGASLVVSGVSFRGIGGEVPEPGSIALLAGLSVTSAGFLARRKRSKAA